jgi:tetratricopeptide (TPR) repeat protein/DNA-binding MarR family transcriptional regulator
VTDHHALSVALYNPDLVGRKEFIAQFVARQPLLERMIEDLRHPRPQHRLLIGQRGMGKSTLLRRLRFAVEDDRALAARWTPLTFPEEQYNVARLSDFWANCLDALSDTLTARGDTEGARVLDDKIDHLTAADEDDRAKVALTMLRDFGKKSKRGFVLLIDNLDLLLDRLSKQEHWTLRKALDHADMAIVGACVAPPESAFDHGGAFYDWFQVDELRSLSLDEARYVLLRLAKARNAPHVEEIVRNDPGRVAALHQLTGGNPRTLMLLHDLFARDDVRSVEHDLLALLDHCTPLYKARFESLPQQQQQVMDALALHWAPATAADIAGRTRLAVQGVSSQIDRLVRQGVVEKVPSDNSRQLFQVGERFFNIWYLMRASRRMRRTLIWLAEFLRIFYGEVAMRLRARELSLVPLPTLVDERERHLSLMMAIAQVVDDRGARHALEVRAAEAIIDTGELRMQLAEILDLHGDDAHLKPTFDRLAALRELENQVRCVKVRMRKGWEPKKFWKVLGGAASLTLEEKRHIVAELPAMAPERLRALMEQLIAEESVWMKGARTKQLPEAIRRGYMMAADDVEGAAGAEPTCGVELVDEAIQRTLEEHAEPDVLAKIGPFLPHAAEPETWVRWVMRAIEAGAPIDEFTRWTEQTNQPADFWKALLVTITNKLMDSRNRIVGIAPLRIVIALFERVLSFSPSDEVSLRELGRMEAFLERFARAAEFYQRLVRLPNAAPMDWYELAKCQSKSQQKKDAEEAWRRCLELDPGLWRARVEFADALIARSEREAMDVLREGPRSPEVELFLGSLQRLYASEDTVDTEKRIVTALPEVSDPNILLFAWYHLALLEDSLTGKVEARIQAVPTTPVLTLPMIGSHLNAGRPDGARALLVPLLDAFSKLPETHDVTTIVVFTLRLFVRGGQAPMASEVFDASPLADRLLPLQAALRILAFPERYSLERLAAEIREPTRDVIKDLSEHLPALELLKK